MKRSDNLQQDNNLLFMLERDVSQKSVYKKYAPKLLQLTFSTECCNSVT